MPASTVLAALTPWFSHPENIATEALLHILSSSTADNEMRRFLKSLAPQCPVPVHWRSQAAQDGAIPDLIGVDASGTETVIIENKFWAGLTDAQPCKYFDRLRAGPSLVLFVVPSERLNLVWPELLLRCRRSGLPALVADGKTDPHVAKICDNQVLGLISWRSLLMRLNTAARDAKEDSLCNDISQLSGLCDKMDTQAFLPLRPEELTDTSARRIVQFNELVDELAGSLVAQGPASKKGLRATGARGWYCQYLSMCGYALQLSFNANHWNSYGASPIWLRVSDVETWQAKHDITDYMQSLFPDLLVKHSEEDRGTLLPVYLKTNVERDVVLSEALSQLTRITEALAAKPLATTKVSQPPEEER